MHVNIHTSQTKAVTTKEAHICYQCTTSLKTVMRNSKALQQVLIFIVSGTTLKHCFPVLTNQLDSFLVFIS